MQTHHEGIPILDHATNVSLLKGERGCNARDYDANPWGSLGFAAPFAIDEIPRDEWKERIEEMERTKSRLSDIAAAVGWKPTNQGYTNYCWSFGTAMAVELARIAAGQKFVRLSAVSVAGPVTNYQNAHPFPGKPAGIGGWAGEAIEYGFKFGWDEEEHWPNTAAGITAKLDTADSKQRRTLYQADDWLDLKPRSFGQWMTCLLLRYPCPTAHNRWRHLTCGVDPVYTKDGRFGVKVANSGYGRNAEGWTLLTEDFGPPDECLAIKVVTAA